jgi:hypothetical protein
MIEKRVMTVLGLESLREATPNKELGYVRISDERSGIKGKMVSVKS